MDSGCVAVIIESIDKTEQPLSQPLRGVTIVAMLAYHVTKSAVNNINEPEEEIAERHFRYIQTTTKCC